jgi:eukaryotic-like serine/threonine-protein kinase
VLGTASYMSPEQTRCQRADPRSDVWSLGIVLYEMLAGGPPFAGSSSDAICYAIRNDRVPRLSMGVPAPLRRLVIRALSKDPSRRPTASAFARKLRDLQRPGWALSTTISAVVRSANARLRPDALRVLASGLTQAYSALATAAHVAAHTLKGSAPRIRTMQ